MLVCLHFFTCLSTLSNVLSKRTSEWYCGGLRFCADIHKMFIFRQETAKNLSIFLIKTNQHGVVFFAHVLSSFLRNPYLHFRCPLVPFPFFIHALVELYTHRSNAHTLTFSNCAIVRFNGNVVHFPGHLFTTLLAFRYASQNVEQDESKIKLGMGTDHEESRGHNKHISTYMSYNP